MEEPRIINLTISTFVTDCLAMVIRVLMEKISVFHARTFRGSLDESLDYKDCKRGYHARCS